MAIEVTDANFDEVVLQSAKPVLVDFWAEWCGPCKMIAPHVEAIADSYVGKVKVVQINIDENPKSPEKYSVRGIPTLLFFKDGKIIANKVGALTKNQLVDFIEANI